MQSILWRALGRNTIISILLFGALLGLLWLVETCLLSYGEVGRGALLRWHDSAWLVGIPASVIGVAYILTIRDPQNYTGFYAGIIMSALLGMQFILQGGIDSAFLYFFVFIPFQIKSVINWSKPAVKDDQPFSPEFLSTKTVILTRLVYFVIIACDYLLATYVFQHNGLLDNVAVKLFNAILIASSIMANFWLIYRKTDAWIYWMLYSLSGIGLFILLNNIFSIVLFAFFMVINSMAGLAWMKGTKPEDLGWIKRYIVK